MISGWFSALRADGTIASGDRGIYVTPPSLPGQPEPPATKVSEVGLHAVWAGQTLVFNRNDGTTQIGLEGAGKLSQRVQTAYNDYVACDGGQWAGGVKAGLGRVDRYHGATVLESVPLACEPRFYGLSFGWLEPYQTGADFHRSLVIDGMPKASGVILDWRPDRAGGSYVYVVSTGTYTKMLIDNVGNNVTIRGQQDEAPQVVFTGPDGYPWMLSQTTNSGSFVRMIYSAFGYVIPGILDNPDARIIGSQLRVVGSDAGMPRNLWIDFTAPKVDLRLV